MRRQPWTSCFSAVLCAAVFACGGTKGETTESAGTDPSTGETSSTTQQTSVTTVDPTSGTSVGPSTTDEPTGGTVGGTLGGTVGDTPGTTTTGETTSTTAEPETEGTTMGGVPMPVACGGKIYQCGDAMDNDGDGKIDGGDPECTSPCDDNESSFATDLPGQNLDCNNDCYWDDDSGAGNDKCEYDLQCDPANPGGAIGCEFQMECDPSVPAQCLEVCSELVPNGCDCFGCCHVETDAGTIDIFLGSGPDCSLANPDACGKCTFQETCNNLCDPDNCELCFGQEELPEDCDMPTCDGDKTPCTVDKNGVSNCADGFFCSTGCCQPIEPG